MEVVCIQAMCEMKVRELEQPWWYTLALWKMVGAADKVRTTRLAGSARSAGAGGSLGRGRGPPTGLRWRAMSSSGSSHGCKLKKEGFRGGWGDGEGVGAKIRKGRGGGFLFKKPGCRRVKKLRDKKWWHRIAGVGNVSQEY